MLGLLHTSRELGEEVARVVVDDGVGRVEPKSIDVVLVDPVQGVLDEELADHLALVPVKVQRMPHGFVCVSEK